MREEAVAHHPVDERRAGPTVVARVDLRRVQVLQAEVHRPLRPLRFTDNAARHDVARGEVAGGVVIQHERFAGRINQPSAFAAQRLGQQESRSTLDMECSGMKLDELDVGDVGSGAPGGA